MNQQQHDLAVKEIIVAATTKQVGTTVARLVGYFGVEAIEPVLNEAFEEIAKAAASLETERNSFASTRTFVAGDTAERSYRMEEAPAGPSYHKNFTGVCDGVGPCIYCGKTIRSAMLGMWVNDDGSMIVHGGDLQRRIDSGDAVDDMGMEALGSDCARLLRSKGLGEYILDYHTRELRG